MLKKNPFNCNDSKITEFQMVGNKNSTAYVLMYKMIT